MKRLIVYTLLAGAFLFSCKKTKEQQIMGSWRAITLENPEMDSFFIKSQMFIDTLGKNNDPAVNIQLYGSANIDSLRQVLQAQYDSARAMQAGAVVNTVFEFRKDSVAVLSFSGVTDSGKWHFDKEGALIIIPFNKMQADEKVKMDVMVLSDTLLKLKLTEEGGSSIVTFKPEKQGKK